MRRRECDALVFGGGFAGLWILERLLAAGYDAVLLESNALGHGQSIQAQGIIHGGGKYALRGVRDFAAASAIREMPATWRACLNGRAQPDLSSAQLLSDRCHLWIPRGGWISRLSAWGIMSVVQQAGLLHAKPQKLDPSEWPEALRGSARAVYAMPEPVLSTGSALAALGARHRGRILRVDGPQGYRIYWSEDGQIHVELSDSDRPLEARQVTLAPRAVLLAAGAGNEALLAQLELDGAPMQRRPLLMALLRGPLPPLFAHCVKGGKTAMTVTSHPWERNQALSQSNGMVWQLGGEVAERFAGQQDGPEFRDAVRASLRELLPGLSLEGLELSAYVAVRAEARSSQHRRPSGVHARWVADKTLVTWPTKMALTPLLADEVVEEMSQRIGPPSGSGEAMDWPTAGVALDPWREEGLQWRPLI